ncbi:hypothetical protein [Streptomyces sp. AC1-42T]|uniref:hypothetical protein n=1 Tax=Streptomyces sp. AC1-42T TaxID=2218665 RepID=UPI000DABE198|nr:hypothetical protein [Streptomyces sp. AC1-42T]PZT71575.1 hypothetical protein DNK55_33260 [Streptomyces sp. AC1-42T]
MAGMLARTAPRYAGRECRCAGRRGCICFHYAPGALANPRERAKFRALERRRARAAEKRAWARPN